MSGIVLAAGRSTRMGAPKPLLPLRGEPLLRHVLRAAIASRLDEVLVVVGFEADRVVAAVGDTGHQVIVNPDYLDGQASSLRAGVAAISPRSGAVLVLLGDQPEVSTAVIDAVIAVHVGAGAAIVRPSYRGVPGHPVLFERCLVPELLTLSGDTGARDVLRRRAGEVRHVEVDTDLPPDVDTPEAFAALVARWSSG
ncbi:MAG: nucleotidyltransferase family protein [Chloroflexia bacterium]|nr:nucleotidyltransferase family protein [Chloroflexia bacterium]